jgi:hypothetical protein
LAGSLGVSFAEARKIYDHHKATYARYWKWSDDCLANLKATGVCRLDGDGWALWLDGASIKGDDELTCRNFPVQAFASAISRRATIEVAKLAEPIATMHDSILVQAPAAEAKKKKKAVMRTMEDVSREFLGGNAIRVTPNVYKGRFTDKDGVKTWERVKAILRKYE